MTKKSIRSPRQSKPARSVRSVASSSRRGAREKEPGAVASAKEPRPRHRAATERDLIVAVQRVLATQGATALTPSNVAHSAAVDKALIYRYFGSFEGLIEAFTKNALYWPTEEEVAPDRDVLLKLPFGERMTCVLLRYARALRARPDTLAILAGELAERGEFQNTLEARREAFGQAMFALGRDAPADFDAAAAATVLTGAIHYLLIRGQQVSIFNGIALDSEAGWQRIEAMIAQFLDVNLQALQALPLIVAPER